MALSRLDEIRESLGARQRALAELEAEAGIADAAEKLRSEPESYDGICEISYEESINRNLRKLYFSVRDVGLRRDLIRADQEVADTLRHFWRQHLSDATVREKAAPSANKFWWVGASICGTILIGLGFHFFGLAGALAGLLAGYLWSRQMEQSALRARQEEIADAGSRLRYAKEMWNEARREKRKFSDQEAKTGEPDSVSEHPARHSF